MTAPAADPDTQRSAPAATATEVPIDGNQAYRMGLCKVCKTAPYSAGRTRCDACHQNYCGGLVPGLTRNDNTRRRRTEAA
jgi:hypothetical protein